MVVVMMTMFLSRTGEGNKPQPDNHSAIQAGKLTKDAIDAYKAMRKVHASSAGSVVPP